MSKEGWKLLGVSVRIGMILVVPGMMNVLCHMPVLCPLVYEKDTRDDDKKHTKHIPAMSTFELYRASCNSTGTLRLLQTGCDRSCMN